MLRLRLISVLVCSGLLEGVGIVQLVPCGFLQHEGVVLVGDAVGFDKL